jgi:hypothetical protein
MLVDANGRVLAKTRPELTVIKEKTLITVDFTTNTSQMLKRLDRFQNKNVCM